MHAEGTPGPRLPGADVAVRSKAPATGKKPAKTPTSRKTTPTAKASSKTSKAKASGKHAGGRPAIYDKDFHPKLAEAWATAGRTDKQIAEKLGMAESTINLWKNQHSEFLEALNRGKTEPDDNVERCLYERATGYVNRDAVKIFMPANAHAPVYAPYEEHVAPDVTAQIFWLKNRRPDRWRERVELGGFGGGPLEVVAMTPEQRDKRIAELLEKVS